MENSNNEPGLTDAQGAYLASEPWKEWFKCPGCGGRVHVDEGRATGGTCAECYEEKE